METSLIVEKVSFVSGVKLEINLEQAMAIFHLLNKISVKNLPNELYYQLKSLRSQMVGLGFNYKIEDDSSHNPFELALNDQLGIFYYVKSNGLEIIKNQIKELNFKY